VGACERIFSDQGQKLQGFGFQAAAGRLFRVFLGLPVTEVLKLVLGSVRVRVHKPAAVFREKDQPSSLAQFWAPVEIGGLNF
jgi:hypothetical protein